MTTPTQGELEAVWSDTILPSLVVKAKSRFSAGRWIDSDADAVVYALPNQRALDRCADAKELVTDALSAHFGRPVSLRLTLDAGGGPPPPGRGGRSSGPTESEPARARRSGSGSGSKEPAGAAPDDGPDPDDYESYNPDELADAHDAAATSIERITSVFAGAELVTDE